MKSHHLTRLGGIAIGAAFLSAEPAMGQMSPVSISGSMEGSTFIESWIVCGPGDMDSGSAEAPDSFAPWNVSLVVESESCGWIRSISRLSSTLTPSDVHLVGDTGFEHSSFPSMTVAWAMGGCRIWYSFHVRTSTAYVLLGSTESLGFQTFVALNGPEGEIFFLLSDHGPFSTSGELAPGDYVLSAQAMFQIEYNGQSIPDTGGSMFDVVLSMTPPACPCDWDTDSSAGTADFFAFLDDFFDGAADFNFDGVTDSQDFFDFLACFFAPPAGCN